MNAHRVSLALGGLFMAAGVGVNKFTLEAFATDGAIESGMFVGAIFAFNVMFIALGLYLLMRPGKTALVNLAVLGVTSLLLCVFAELAARVFVFGVKGLSYTQMRSTHLLWNAGVLQPSALPGVLYELKPNLDELYWMAPLRTNAMGMPDEEVRPEKGANELRIAVLGDSFTTPAGIALEDAWHTRVEALLDQRLPGREVQCLSFGVPGYGLPQYRAMLEAKALALQPDMVIIGWCAENDHLLIPEEYFTRSVADSKVKNGFWRSVLIEVAMYVNYQPFYEMNKAPTPEEVEYVRIELERLAALCREHELPVLIAYLASVPRESEVLARLAEEQGFDFVDVSAAFKGRRLADYMLYHPIDSHPNVAAQEVFVEEVAGALEKMLKSGQ